MGAARKGVWSAEGLREDLPETFGQGLRLLAAFFVLSLERSLLGV